MSYADVNGLTLWYEVHGEGDPLVLLHGGFGAVESYGPLLPALSAGRQVIGVDLQGHGRTADAGRPLRYETMGDDVAALIRFLGHAQADVMGYSLGAGAALRCAVQHPALVRRLIVASTPCRRSGWFPEVLEGMAQVGTATAEQMRGTPMHELYAHVAPRPEDWPVLAGRIGELLAQDYDWSGELRAITARPLLVFADADSVPVSHVAEFYALLGGGLRDATWDGTQRSAARLSILPGRTHYDVLAAPELADVIIRFLEHRQEP